MNIFVSNVNFQTDEDSLKELFEQHGEVTSVKIIKDRETGKSRGFGFVEMPDANEAQSAIKDLNGKEVEKRKLVVNESIPKK